MYGLCAKGQPSEISITHAQSSNASVYCKVAFYNEGELHVFQNENNESFVKRNTNPPALQVVDGIQRNTQEWRCDWVDERNVYVLMMHDVYDTIRRSKFINIARIISNKNPRRMSDGELRNYDRFFLPAVMEVEEHHGWYFNFKLPQNGRYLVMFRDPG